MCDSALVNRTIETQFSRQFGFAIGIRFAGPIHTQIDGILSFMDKLCGFVVENTGGGCQWLRRGQLAITDGECGIPKRSQPCRLFTLTIEGSPIDGDDGMPFASLDAAFAYVRFLDTHYNRKAQ